MRGGVAVDAVVHILAAFHLTTLLELFHPYCLSSVKQGRMMPASIASIKWNASIEDYGHESFDGFDELRYINIYICMYDIMLINIII